MKGKKQSAKDAAKVLAKSGIENKFKGHTRNDSPGQWQVGEDHLDWEFEDVERALKNLTEALPEDLADRVHEAKSSYFMAVEEFKGQAEGVIDRLIEYQEDLLEKPPENYQEIARLAADLVRYLDGDTEAPDLVRLRDLLRGLANLKDERGGHVDHTPVGYVAPCPPQEPVPFEWAPGTTPLLVTEGWRAGGRR